MGLSPAAILYDSSGNPVAIVSDGGVYRIAVLSKILDSSGLQINPATEETLDSIKDTDGIKKITDQLPTGTNTIGGIVLRDIDGNVIDVFREGNFDYLSVRDVEQFGLLNMILAEMKKTNFYLSQISDVRIANIDVEDL